MTSEAQADGSAGVTLTFAQGTDPDTAQVQVQNKLSTAMPLLPQEVQQQGVRVNKPARNFLTVMGFISADNSMNGAEITDYVATNILDPLNRTRGVGDVHDLRRAVRHAHLGGSGQAQQLRADHRRRGQRPSARRTCRCRWARWAACRPPKARPTPRPSSAQRVSPRPNNSATSCCA